MASLPSKVVGSHPRRKRIILDDSSSSGDNDDSDDDVVVVNNPTSTMESSSHSSPDGHPPPKAVVRRSFYDDLSDSSSSLEGYIKGLITIKNTPSPLQGYEEQDDEEEAVEDRRSGTPLNAAFRSPSDQRDAADGGFGFDTAVRSPPKVIATPCIYNDLSDSSSLEGFIKGSVECLSPQCEFEEQDATAADERQTTTPSSVESRSTSGGRGSLDDADGFIEAVIEAGAAFDFDTETREVFISKSKRPDIDWPHLRLPSSLFRQLYDYQKAGVQWMASLHENKIGGIVGDDMGMGKTFMTLAFIGGLMKAGSIRSALVVAPLSILRAWEKEASKVLTACLPNANIVVISSDLNASRRRRILQKALQCPDDERYLVISTYGLVRSSTNDFIHTQSFWDYVVLDEGHQIRNQNADTSQCCRRICENPDTRRLLLTGTPILNSLTELWSLFDWATSGQVLGGLRSFKQQYAKPIELARDKNATARTIKIGERVNLRLQTLIKPYFLQRLKIDFLADKLPEKTELVVWTHLSSQQRKRYTEFVEGDSIVRSILCGDIKSPLEAITWLKKLCGHPLLSQHQGDSDFGRVLDDQVPDDVIAQSAKLQLLVDLIDRLRNKGHRTLIFSQSTRMLDIIQMSLLGVTLGRIDGSTPEKLRQQFVDDFNDEEGSIEAMLLSTKAAGVGLTLVGADRVVIYDPSWTPAEDSQAVDRCYRIGQTREVVVYRLIAAGTVEEKMYEKQVHKDGISRTVFTQKEPVERYFDRNDLRNLFTLAPPGVCAVMEKVKEATKGSAAPVFNNSGFVFSLSGVVGMSRHDGFYKSSKQEEGEGVPFDGRTPQKQVLGRSQRIMERESKDVVALGTNLRNAEREKIKENVEIDLSNLSIGDSSSDLSVSSVKEDGGKLSGKSSNDRQHNNAFLTSSPAEYATEAKVAVSDTEYQGSLQERGQESGEAESSSEEGNLEDEAEMSVATMFQFVQAYLSTGQPRRAFALCMHLLEYRYHDLDADHKTELYTLILQCGVD